LKINKEQHFKDLYELHVNELYRFVLYKVKNNHLAEEIVQDAFIKFWTKIEDVKKGNERAYLYTTCKNIILNKKAHQKVVDKHRLQIRISSIPSPLFELEKSEFKQKLEDTIANLPDGQREVFLMNRIEGFKYKEIAEKLGISQKAVEKRMSQALIVLRKLYKNI